MQYIRNKNDSSVRPQTGFFFHGRAICKDNMQELHRIIDALRSHLGANWEPFGRHLGSLWELEAEVASGRQLDAFWATPPQRNA